MTEVEAGEIRSSFDDFLEEEGLTHDASRIATKKILAAMIRSEMEKRGISRSAMAVALRSSDFSTPRMTV